jgi:hypothetical protein
VTLGSNFSWLAANEDEVSAICKPFELKNLGAPYCSTPGRLCRAGGTTAEALPVCGSARIWSAVLVGGVGTLAARTSLLSPLPIRRDELLSPSSHSFN